MIVDFLPLTYYIREKIIVREIEINALSPIRPLVTFAELHFSVQHIHFTPAEDILHLSLQGSIAAPQLRTIPRLFTTLTQAFVLDGQSLLL